MIAYKCDTLFSKGDASIENNHNENAKQFKQYLYEKKWSENTIPISIQQPSMQDRQRFIAKGKCGGISWGTYG